MMLRTGRDSELAGRRNQMKPFQGRVCWGRQPRAGLAAVGGAEVDQQLVERLEQLPVAHVAAQHAGDGRHGTRLVGEAGGEGEGWLSWAFVGLRRVHPTFFATGGRKPNGAVPECTRWAEFSPIEETRRCKTAANKPNAVWPAREGPLYFVSTNPAPDCQIRGSPRHTKTKNAAVGNTLRTVMWCIGDPTELTGQNAASNDVPKNRALPKNVDFLVEDEE